MLFFGGVGGLVIFGLWIFCFIDVLVTPERACRTLPKLAWVFIALLPLIGAVCWLLAGRPWVRPREYVSDRSSSRYRSGDADAPADARRAPIGPDDDEEFLATLRARADEQRRRGREQQDRDGESG